MPVLSSAAKVVMAMNVAVVTVSAQVAFRYGLGPGDALFVVIVATIAANVVALFLTWLWVWHMERRY